jgi:hypothetical protein
LARNTRHDPRPADDRGLEGDRGGADVHRRLGVLKVRRGTEVVGEWSGSRH